MITLYAKYQMVAISGVNWEDDIAIIGVNTPEEITSEDLTSDPHNAISGAAMTAEKSQT